jgi:hypothetical protein
VHPILTRDAAGWHVFARIADQRCAVKAPATTPPVVSMTIEKSLDRAA